MVKIRFTAKVFSTALIELGIKKYIPMFFSNFRRRRLWMVYVAWAGENAHVFRRSPRGVLAHDGLLRRGAIL